MAILPVGQILTYIKTTSESTNLWKQRLFWDGMQHRSGLLAHKAWSLIQWPLCKHPHMASDPSESAQSIRVDGY